MTKTASATISAAHLGAVVPPTADANGLASALRQWRGLLGPEHVFCREAVLDRYAQTTLPTGNRALAVLRPETTAEVSELVKIASAQRVPIYPISRGKNWGYGDACPVTGGQVIVDLGRMNRILEVNTELAYAVIQPGVTQGQLAGYLKETSSGLMLDVTGAGPDASIVGNTLERGFGHTPYGDHFAHNCGMEVVLADGSVLNTGFGAFENAQAASVFPWGIGPWLDGLFTQSNFGVVTKLRLHLMPVSPVVEAFALRVNAQQLGPVIDRLRQLRLAEVVRSTVHIANDLRVLSSRQRFRDIAADAPCPLPEPLRAGLRKQAGLGAWNVFGGLYAPREMRRGLRLVVRRAFRGVAPVTFINRSRLRWLSAATNALKRFGVGESLGEVAANASAAFDLLEGVPTDKHLAGTAWRSRSAASPRDITSRGLIWISPVLPMTAHACREVTELIESTTARYGFDALMTLSSITPRALCCVTSIHYDKSSDEERRRAMRCYDDLMDRLLAAGYVPYRAGTQSMKKIAKAGGNNWDVVRRIKGSLDAAHILAPGRYA